MASEVGPHVTPWDLGLGLGKLVELGKLVISHPASSFHTLPLIPWHSLLSLLQPAKCQHISLYVPFPTLPTPYPLVLHSGKVFVSIHYVLR